MHSQETIHIWSKENSFIYNIIKGNIASKRIQYVGIDLTTEKLDPYTKNKALLK